MLRDRKYILHILPWKANNNINNIDASHTTVDVSVGMFPAGLLFWSWGNPTNRFRMIVTFLAGFVNS